MDEKEYPDDYIDPNYEPTQPTPVETDSKPLIAGILLLIAGLLGVMTWIAALFMGGTAIDPSLLQTQDMPFTVEQLQTMIQICATIGIILSIFPILGGILSIKKTLWGGALACSIIGLFCIGPVFISSIISLIALILLVMSKNQFIKK